MTSGLSKPTRCLAASYETGKRCGNHAVAGHSFCRSHFEEWWGYAFFDRLAQVRDRTSTPKKGQNVGGVVGERANRDDDRSAA